MNVSRLFLGLTALGICQAQAQTSGEPTTSTISVGSAWYGFHDRMDVTSRVKSVCDGKAACEVPISNDFFGGDPDPGIKKELYIKWTCSALPQGKRAHQGEGTKFQVACP